MLSKNAPATIILPKILGYSLTNGLNHKVLVPHRFNEVISLTANISIFLLKFMSFIVVCFFQNFSNVSCRNIDDNLIERGNLDCVRLYQRPKNGILTLQLCET